MKKHLERGDTNHYPFGMPMDRGIFASNDYRFGFNGKENDNEVKHSAKIKEIKTMKRKFLYIILFLLIVFFAIFIFNKSERNETTSGEELFTNKCHACHDISYKVIGPALSNYVDTSGLFIAFQQNSKSHQNIQLNKDDLNLISKYIYSKSKYVD